jgi:ATP synthase protein I
MNSEPPDNDIEALKQKIEAQQKSDGTSVQNLQSVPTDEQSQYNSQGVRAGSELVVSIVAGGLIGFGLDKALETQPFFLILFLFLGVLTGFWNIYKILNQMDAGIGITQLHRPKKTGKET